MAVTFGSAEIVEVRKRIRVEKNRRKDIAMLAMCTKLDILRKSGIYDYSSWGRLEFYSVRVDKNSVKQCNTTQAISPARYFKELVGLQTIWICSQM